MKKRTLADGSKEIELDQVVTLEVKTKCPTKWKLVDLETGEEYIGQTGQFYHWKKISNGINTDK